MKLHHGFVGYNIGLFDLAIDSSYVSKIAAEQQSPMYINSLVEIFPE